LRLRIAALQTGLRGGLEDQLGEVEGLLRSISRREPRLILLPEGWVSEDPYRAFQESVDRSEAALSRLCRLASEYSVTILGGGLYMHRGRGVAVACPLIREDGSVEGFQEKVHLYGPEPRFAVRGDGYVVFRVMGVRIGVLICHDIAYPEAARTLTIKGAEILFNPSRISASGTEAWHLYLKVRCLENRVPLYAANIWHPPRFLGGTCAVKPSRYEDDVYIPEMVVARPGSAAIVDEIDPRIIGEARMDRLARRVPGAYIDLVGEGLGGVAD